ncbi:MAG: polyprenyl synthetase family protein [Parachlamydiaceae bacterium]|nr:polyprenyl synthetase family protein [Parachlamydiaceae bacterium]
MDFSDYLQSKHSHIESKLNELVPERFEAPYNQLFQAARYALMGGGKRLRPLLAITTAEAFGKNCEAALSAACALEMIHTYSLIHDDLPCMDDDDFRRGKPSLHKAFTEGHAVLTGDYLLTYAFEVIAKDPQLLPEQKVALIDLLAKNSGGEGMIAGQVMDIEAEGRLIEIDQLRHIHKHKTGAMITASVACGGIVANASPGQMKILCEFGDDIGLAFQIIDDVIDVTASFQKHGKTVSSDSINNKSTYVTLLGLEPARQAANELLKEAHLKLDLLQIECRFLRELSTRLVQREI